MQILAAAAADFELNAVKKRLKGVADIDFAVMGVGVLPTAYSLTRLLSQKKYDWVFNVGIAGTFSNKIALGEAVVVERESLGESGVESVEGAISAFPKELQSGVDLRCPYVSDFPFLQSVKKASGITVNLLTESKLRVQSRASLADVETMEGAAFFYVCLREKVKFLQLRGISNQVGERDKAKWEIAEALNSVGDLLMLVLCNL